MALEIVSPSGTSVKLPPEAERDGKECILVGLSQPTKPKM